MSQAPTSASGLVRVTVASGTRRVDLVLPGAVPLAELVPELARSVGLLDPGTVYGGYRVVTREGRELSGEAGLAIQGIEDGGLLTVTAGVDDEPPRVYDDVVEAMTDVVERDLKPWDPAAGRRTALTAAALLMALGGVALFIQDSLLAAVAAAVVALTLVAGAIVLSRAQREPEAAVAVAWMGTFYAAVAGIMLAPDGLVFGLPVAYAGANTRGTRPPAPLAFSMLNRRMASDRATLKAQERTEFGSRTSRRLRRAGLVPGVVYGGGSEARRFRSTSARRATCWSTEGP